MMISLFYFIVFLKYMYYIEMFFFYLYVILCRFLEGVGVIF